MKKILSFFFLFFLLEGCWSKPAPLWIATGNQQLETYKIHFLAGRQPAVTERYFQKAIEEIKKSGDLDILGRAWLTRIALQSAVLEAIEEGDYGKIASAQPVPENRNFYLFLTGNPAAVDGALLPAKYQLFLKILQEGDIVKIEKTIASMTDDPLSQLIASGLALRHHQVNEAILQTAIGTASRNGWKRALLAWLERLRMFYETKGDMTQAEAIRQRIDITGK